MTTLRCFLTASFNIILQFHRQILHKYFTLTKHPLVLSLKLKEKGDDRGLTNRDGCQHKKPAKKKKG